MPYGWGPVTPIHVMQIATYQVRERVLGHAGTAGPGTLTGVAEGPDSERRLHFREAAFSFSFTP